MQRLALAILAVPLALSTAHADEATQSSPLPMPMSVRNPFKLEPAAEISNIIYLNRCATGCTITQSSNGTSSARNNQTWLGGDGAAGNPGSGAPGATYTITPFGYDDASWDAMVQCVTDIYAPYNVTITEVDPGPTVLHHEAIVAGVAADLGLNDGIGGVGPLDCMLHDDTVSFSFANVFPDNPAFLCAVVGQETGHGFGIEHTYNCSDPLAAGYVPGCGAYFFRNETVQCANESSVGPRNCGCNAGGLQNVHGELTAAFGASLVPLPPPDATMNVPANGATLPAGNQFTISAVGDLERGIGRAELWFNGWKWLTIGATKSVQGAPYQNRTFVLTAPADLADGVIDVEVRIYNDLETVYASAAATVTKGAPCGSADDCAAGQLCDAGKCYWEPPVGQLGEDCEYNQYCVTEVCAPEGVCSKDCIIGVSGDCPDLFECVDSGGGTSGVCLAIDSDEPGGCCSVGDETPTAGLLAQLGLAGLVLGGMMRRRRPSTPRSP
jgi:MYXO-CTERM domain-containing protein